MQTHSNLQLKRYETRQLGCSVKPYEDQNIQNTKLQFVPQAEHNLR